MLSFCYCKEIFKLFGLGLMLAHHVVQGEMECDEENGDLLFTGVSSTLSALLEESDNFKCSDQYAQHVTILLFDTLTIDTQFVAVSDYSRPFLWLVLVAKNIKVEIAYCEHIPGGCTDIFRLDGRSGYTSPKTVRGKWASGINGGKFLGIAQKWITPNKEDLNVMVSGGRGGCRGVPQFSFENSEDVIYEDGKELRPVTLQEKKQHYKFTREDVGSVRKLTSERLISAEGGEPGENGGVFAVGGNSRIVVEVWEEETLESLCRSHPNDPEPVIYETKESESKYYAEQSFYDTTDPEVGETRIRSITKRIYNWFVFDFVIGRNLKDKTIKSWNLLLHAGFSKLPEYDNVLMDEFMLILENSNDIEDKVERRIVTYLAEVILKAKSTRDDKLLWLYSACSAHRTRLERHTDLVTNLKAYIDPLRAQLRNFTDTLKRNAYIEKVASDYQTETNRQISEAKDSVQNVLLPQLETIQNKLVSEFDRIKVEIETEIKKAKGDLKLQEENLKNAIALSVANTIFGFIKAVAAGIAYVFPPISNVISSGLEAGVGIGEGVVENIHKPKDLKGYNVPESIRRDIQPVTSWIDRKRTLLLNQLNGLLQRFQNDPDVWDTFNSMLSEVQALEGQPKRYQHSEAKRIRQEMLDQLHELTKVQPRRLEPRKAWNQDRHDNAIAGLNDVSNAANSAVTTYFGDSETIKNAKNQINQTKKDIADMESFKEKLIEKILPMVLDMVESLSVASDEFDGEKVAAIDISAWSIKQNVMDVKHEVMKSLGSFATAPDIGRSFDMMDSLMATMSSVYSRVATSKETQRFVDLVVALTKPGSPAPAIDPERKRMEKILADSVAASYLEQCKFAFSMWAFPFASVFLRTIPDLSVDFNLRTNDIIETAVEQLDEISSIVAHYFTEINDEIDHHRASTMFYTGFAPGSNPFYVWEWETHELPILDFLSGKSVVFNADIRNYQAGNRNFKKEVIKFESISLRFLLKPKSSQKRFNKGLSKFKLNMVHMGISYYVFQEQIYVFNTGVSRFGIPPGNFQGKPDFTGQTFSLEKYSAGDATLSPYGPWRLRLTAHEHDSNYESLLLKPGETLSIHLIGSGSFVEPFEDDVFTDPDINNYFESIHEDDVYDGDTEEETEEERRGIQIASDYNTTAKGSIPATHKHFTEDSQGEVHYDILQLGHLNHP